MAKLLGPTVMNKTIGGIVCSPGLKISTTEGVGTRIEFSVRNMIHDLAGQLYLIDTD